MRNYQKLVKLYKGKKILVANNTKPNEYLTFLPTLWHEMILISQYLALQ